MEEDVTGSGGRLGKRPSESGMEVDYKVKAGTAWSHSYLNQKPWHPLSYPNQRRKWIAEQTHANHARRAEEVAREFAQEQQFFRQTALFSKKEKEKVEMMKAVSFMYVRPPGYDAESAKAAEIADEQKRLGQTNIEPNTTEGTSSQIPDSKSSKNQAGDKKSRPKDVFGRTLPTEEEFEVLKNAPRLETGVAGRIKPFGVEIRNVRCVRCGTFGHQSGDRECPLKDVIMPNEETRLKRDDPLTAIMAQTDSSEPSKWELKHKPGMSPPRGGFEPDDPNQQIIPDDIFDEYGGFLGGGDIPLPLSNFSTGKSKKHSKRKNKHKHGSSETHTEHKKEHSMSSDSDAHKDSRKGAKRKSRQASRHHSISSPSDSESDEDNKQQPKSKYKKCKVPTAHDSDKTMKKYPSYSGSDRSDEESKRQSECKHKRRHSLHSDDKSNKARMHQPRRKNKKEYSSSSDSERDEKSKQRPRIKHTKEYSSSSDSERDEGSKRRSRTEYKKECSSSSDSERDEKSKRRSKKRSLSPDSENEKESTQRSKSKYKKKHQRHVSSYFDPEVDRESRRDSKRNIKERPQQEPWCSEAEADTEEGRRRSTGKYFTKRSHSDSNARDDYESGRYNSHRHLGSSKVHYSDQHHHQHHRKHRHEHH